MKQNLETAIQAIQNNQLTQAEKLLKQLEPDMMKDPEFWNVRAMLCVNMSDFTQAINYLQKAINLKPNNITYYFNNVLCHKALNQYTEAENQLKQAIEIEPNNPEIKQKFYKLFEVTMQDKQLFDKYIDNINNKNIDPNLLYNIALQYSLKLKIHKALHFYMRALEKDPINKNYLLGFIQAVSACKKYEEGIDFLESLNQKENVKVFMAFLKIRQKKWDDYHENIQIVLDDTKKCLKSPNTIANIAPFHALFFIEDPTINLEIAKRISQFTPPFKFEHKKTQNKKLRIGFISSDFLNHPVAHLCRNLFYYLEKENIETYLYSTTPSDNSEYRQHFKNTSTSFKEVFALSEQEIAQMINKDNIDIAVDMQGLTANIKLSLFSYRPAPIQIEYLGYPGTTGADYIDYIIVDKVIAPEDQQRFFTEKFLYMPNCYQVNDNQQQISNETVTKAQYGLPEDKFIYCCFNNTYKIEPKIFNIWMNILKAVPDSVLWLLSSTPKDDASLKKHAKAQGIAPERIIFTTREAKDKHLKRLQLADLFLDTYVVGAHTTASDSLWAGVPILTCTGNRFVSRVCTSLLTTQGLDELITTSLDEYQRKAIDYAQHPEKITELKQKIATANKTKPLFNTEAYAKDFANLFYSIWNKSIT